MKLIRDPKIRALLLTDMKLAIHGYYAANRSGISFCDLASFILESLEKNGWHGTKEEYVVSAVLSQKLRKFLENRVSDVLMETLPRKVASAHVVKSLEPYFHQNIYQQPAKRKKK